MPMWMPRSRARQRSAGSSGADGTATATPSRGSPAQPTTIENENTTQGNRMPRACRSCGDAAIVRAVLVPDSWAEARIEAKVDERPRVIRRFGWFDATSAEY
jgi:hypothetical protein